MSETVKSYALLYAPVGRSLSPIFFSFSLTFNIYYKVKTLIFPVKNSFYETWPSLLFNLAVV